MPPRENSKLRLLVEGKDDLHSVIHLMRRHGVDWDRDAARLPYVKDVDGISELLNGLSAALKTYDRLGVIVDADSSVSDRYAQLRARMEKVGISLPPAIEKAGVVIPGLRPDSLVGIWIMPDNQSPGILEDFLTRLIPAGDVAIAHAEQATATARELGAPVKDARKGAMYTWLAWREPPGMPFGTALSAAVLRHDSAEASLFADWFKKLFL